MLSSSPVCDVLSGVYFPTIICPDQSLQVMNDTNWQLIITPTPCTMIHTVIADQSRHTDILSCSNRIVKDQTPTPQKGTLCFVEIYINTDTILCCNKFSQILLSNVLSLLSLIWEIRPRQIR